MRFWLILGGLLMASVAAHTAAAESRRLVFAVFPESSPEKLQAMYAPLMAYLSQELGQEAVLYVARDYDDLLRLLQQQKADIVQLGALLYVKIQRALPHLQYMLARKVKDDTGQVRDHYQGVILVARSSRFQALTDLRGAKFAFTDFASTSGYLYPLALLKKAGITPETDFGKVYMLKKHDKVTEAIARGTIDAGATWDGNLAAAVRTHGDVFRVLATTPQIPMDALAAAPHVAPSDVAAVKAALLKLDADHPVLQAMIAAGYYYAGWVARNDAFYDVVREAERTEVVAEGGREREE